MAKFTFFDVETPNYNNDRISSVGIVVVEDGITILEANYLVNPEVRFDPFNIKLTGITPFMVSDAPTFDVLWAELKPYFDGSIIVAHNATFDLGVLTMTLAHYGIEIPHFNYICTVVLAKRFLRYRKNSLDYLCATLGVLLERHHEALSDARGCQGIFYHIVEHYGYSDDLVQTFYKPHLRGKSVVVRPQKTPVNQVKFTLASTTDSVQIRDKVFCLTGDFRFGSKTDVELFILARGGQVVNQVTRQVDYLLVGALGSPLWAYGNYGMKVKRAFECRNAGTGMDVVLEADFFSQL
ncbi:MAG TPA: hypothetical protein DCS67_09070 [Clostridiales bacterium UBA8960]|jgi:DNA polymerase III epsilon subunit family exonuclease|nr:hypothetical protein [Clostridiales bacterium UBA8960]